MSITEEIPQNKNALTKGNFRFGFRKTPNLNYFLQSVSLPGIYAGFVDLPGPVGRKKIPLIGNGSLSYDNFMMSFQVDEDMENYMEIFDWIKGNNAPDNFEQHQEIAALPYGQGIYSDGSLIVSNSSHAPKVEFLIKDMFPIQLSGLEFLTTDPDKSIVTATAEFRFMGYSARRIGTEL